MEEQGWWQDYDGNQFSAPPRHALTCWHWWTLPARVHEHHASYLHLSPLSRRLAPTTCLRASLAAVLGATRSANHLLPTTPSLSSPALHRSS